MVMMIARTGRENQRYENGCRLIAGCIPYKLTEHKTDGCCVESRLQILVVKAQKSEKVLLPKGGWENDETVEEAALREAMEEAGVSGEMGDKLGVWTFSSKGHEDGDHVAHMFPLQVHELEDTWPEKHLRERLWMSAKEARKHFKHQWMREALDKLTHILAATCERKAQPESTRAVDKPKNKVATTCQQKVQPPWMTEALQKLTTKVTATCDQQKAPKQRQAVSQCPVDENFGAIQLEIRVRLQQIVCLFEKRTKHMWIVPRLIFRLFMSSDKERERSFAYGLRLIPWLNGDQKPQWSNGPGAYPCELRLLSPNAFIRSICSWKSNDPSRKSRTRSLL